MLLICSTVSLHFYDSFTPLPLLCIYSAYSPYFALRLSEYIEVVIINCCKLLLLDKYRDPRSHGDDLFTLPTPREPEM